MRNRCVPPGATEESRQTLSHYPAQHICQVDIFSRLVVMIHPQIIAPGQDGCGSGGRVHKPKWSSSLNITGVGPFHRGFIAAGQDEDGSASPSASAHTDGAGPLEAILPPLAGKREAPEAGVSGAESGPGGEQR